MLEINNMFNVNIQPTQSRDISNNLQNNQLDSIYKRNEFSNKLQNVTLFQNKNYSEKTSHKSTECKEKSTNVICIDKKSLSQEGIEFLIKLDETLDSLSNTESIELLAELSVLINSQIASQDKAIDINIDYLNSGDINTEMYGETTSVLEILSDKLSQFSDDTFLTDKNLNFNNEFIDNFADKIKSLLSENEHNIDANKFLETLIDGTLFNLDESIDNKKEDINTIFYNLNTNNSELIAPTSNAVASETIQIHPIAEQILVSIENQLRAYDNSTDDFHLKIKLFPVKLGEISVELRQAENMLVVNMVTENSEIKDVLESSIQDLYSEIQKKFNSEVNIDISHKQQQQGNNLTFSESYKSVNNDTNNDMDEKLLLQNRNTISDINKFLDVKL